MTSRDEFSLSLFLTAAICVNGRAAGDSEMGANADTLAANKRQSILLLGAMMVVYTLNNKLVWSRVMIFMMCDESELG